MISVQTHYETLREAVGPNLSDVVVDFKFLRRTSTDSSTNTGEDNGASQTVAPNKQQHRRHHMTMTTASAAAMTTVSRRL